MLVAGRVISGLAVGIASAIVPIYQSEITAPAIRGRLVSMQQWYVCTLFPPALLHLRIGPLRGVFCCSTLSSLVARTSMEKHRSASRGACR